MTRGLELAGNWSSWLAQEWDSSSHEPLGGQILAVLPHPAGLSQGTGGAAAQPGEQTGTAEAGTFRRFLKSPRKGVRRRALQGEGGTQSDKFLGVLLLLPGFP